ncbi:hypothetical protein [Putridiphycobacter roseus]|uniref:hypothetical protein n=1 Tax=Putridiphycobacter roseus TaxID=2219161 RepID=UPI0036D386DE
MLLIFSVTLFTYNFQRLVKMNFSHFASISGGRLQWMEKHLTIVYVLSILALGLTIFEGSNYVLKIWPLLLVISSFSFFYVWKIPFFKKNIRDIPYIKLYVLAITWVLATCVLPFYLFGKKEDWNWNDWLILLGSLFFMIGIIIPFDMRDVELDHPSHKTIPQLLGLKKARNLTLIFWFFGHVFWSIGANKFEINILAHAIFGAFVLWNCHKNKPELYFSGGVDVLLITVYLAIGLF